MAGVTVFVNAASSWAAALTSSASLLQTAASQASTTISVAGNPKEAVNIAVKSADRAVAAANLAATAANSAVIAVMSSPIAIVTDLANAAEEAAGAALDAANAAAGAAGAAQQQVFGTSVPPAVVAALSSANLAMAAANSALTAAQNATSAANVAATAAAAATATPITLSSSLTLPPGLTGTPPSLTPSTGSSPSSTHTGTQQTNKVSPGVVAGIAIGVAIVAALITLLTSFWCFHNRGAGLKHSRRRRHHSSEKAPLPRGDQNGFKASPYPSRSGNDSPIILEDHLPQPISDKTVLHEVATLNTLIAQHVANFYHRLNVNPAAVTALTIQNPSIRQEQFVGLVTGSGTRQVGLRIYIGASILDCVRVDGDPARTLLPPGVVACIGAMPKGGLDPAVRTEALNRWLIFSSFLLFPTTDDNKTQNQNPAYAQLRDTRIEALVGSIVEVLRPFVQRGKEKAQVEHLREIVKRGARVGITLFGQPGGWTFDWTVGTGKGVVVFPALVRGGEVEREAEVENL